MNRRRHARTCLCAQLLRLLQYVRIVMGMAGMLSYKRGVLCVFLWPFSFVRLHIAEYQSAVWWFSSQTTSFPMSRCVQQWLVAVPRIWMACIESGGW
jgi:hypothetical protein